MSDHDRRPIDLHTPVVPPATASGGNRLPWIVAGLLAVVLAIGYFALGAPVLKAPDQARAPEPGNGRAVHQPAATPVERRP